jgi:hypothetical protein
MKYAIIVSQALVSLTGLALLVLGGLFWTGHALSLIPAHIFIGLVMVASLWVLVGLAVYARAPLGFSLLVLVWSLIVPVIGFAQLSWLPGPQHWIVRTVHLLIGLAAIGFGHMLAKRAARASARRPTA